MKEVIGTVKSTSKNAITIDENGNTAPLQTGDSIYLGNIIKNQANDETIEISMAKGDDIFINANNTLILDKSVVVDESFGDECFICSSSLSKIAQIQENFATLLDDILITQSDTIYLHTENLDTFTHTSKNITIEDNIQTDF